MKPVLNVLFVVIICYLLKHIKNMINIKINYVNYNTLQVCDQYNCESKYKKYFGRQLKIVESVFNYSKKD